MAMMQGSNKPKNIGKPTGGPPLEAMTAENLAPPIEATGNKELALVMNFERTGCFFQMFLDAHAEPGKRSFTFPFRKVLNAAKGLGQFDLTEEEILDQWWRPRYLGYGKAIGVEFKISDMDQNGKVTVELAE